MRTNKYWRDWKPKYAFLELTFLYTPDLVWAIQMYLFAEYKFLNIIAFCRE